MLDTAPGTCLLTVARKRRLRAIDGHHNLRWVVTLHGGERFTFERAPSFDAIVAKALDAGHRPPIAVQSVQVERKRLRRLVLWRRCVPL